MESNARGCEITVSGKLRAQRAKSMKFRDGYMIKAGHPTVLYVDECVRHVMMRQGSYCLLSGSPAAFLSVTLPVSKQSLGVLGIRLAIMLPHDPSGKGGPKIPQPDVVKVRYFAYIVSFARAFLRCFDVISFARCSTRKKRIFRSLPP
jgi:hypothetical protein